MIADELNKLKQTKAQIKQALIDKGQNPTDEFASYASNINSISASKGNLLALKYDRQLDDSNYYIWVEADGVSYEYRQSPNLLIPEGGSDTHLILWQNQQYINDIYINYSGSYNIDLGLGNLNSSSGVILHFGRGLETLLTNGYSINLHIPYVDKCVCNSNDYNLITWIQNQGWSYITDDSEYVYKNGTYFIGDVSYKTCSVIVNGNDGENYLYTESNTLITDVSAYQPINSMRFQSGDLKEIVSFPDTSTFTSMELMFQYVPVKDYRFLKDFNTSNVTNMCSMFYHTTVEYIDTSSFDTSKVTTMESMFFGADISSGTVLDLSGWNTSNVTNMWAMFRDFSSNSDVLFPEGFGKNCANMNYMFYYASLPAIYNIDWSSISSINNFASGYSRKIQIKNLGTQSGLTSVDFGSCNAWGVDISNLQNCKQTVIDTLINYSFDRATAGYSACSISLASRTKALLTEEEIAQITAKGYTIA